MLCDLYRGIMDWNSVSLTTEGPLRLKEFWQRVYVTWSKCCFRGLSTPANKYISWGKHWTEMFMDLSLAVLQKTMYKWEADHYRLKKKPMKFIRSFMHLQDIFQYLCCSRLTPCALSDCDAWGHKSTASCLDFNMVLSVLALILNSSPLPTIPLLYFSCLSLLTNFVDKLCFPL